MREIAQIRVKRRPGVQVLLIALAVMTFAVQGRAADRPAVKWQPLSLSNGSPVLFEIRAPAKLRSVSAAWMGHDISFFNLFPAGNVWYGLGGVPLSTIPGNYDLQLKETFPNGQTLGIARKIRVIKATYPKITVKVAKQYTAPSPQQLTAISADKDVKSKIFEAVSAKRLWKGRFVSPVSAPVSDVFGTARVFNEQVQSRHQGLDFAVPPGTEVHAIKSGVVILARPMFLEGDCVGIDHGQGLRSLYLHLSEFKVKEGDEVRAGELIGLSGGTGRASGPHLHLAVRWQGVYLSPAILLKLQIPNK
jgi:murein DD-endopeptidase MepM/ murein hydrolase activator NlpD